MQPVLKQVSVSLDHTLPVGKARLVTESKHVPPAGSGGN